MKFCPNCGVEILKITGSSKSNFCSECGFSLKIDNLAPTLDKSTIDVLKKVRPKVSIEESSAIGRLLLLRFVSSKVFDLINNELSNINDTRDRINYIDKMGAYSIEQLSEYFSISIDLKDCSENYAIDAFDFVEFINLTDSNRISYKEKNIFVKQMKDHLVMRQLGLTIKDVNQYSHALVSGVYGYIDFYDAVTDAENYFVFDNSKSFKLEFSYGGLKLIDHDIIVPIFAVPNSNHIMEEVAALVAISSLTEVTVGGLYDALDNKIILSERPDFIINNENNTVDTVQETQKVRVQGTAYGYQICLKFISEKVKDELLDYFNSNPNTVYGGQYVIQDELDSELAVTEPPINQDLIDIYEDDSEEMDTSEKVFTMMDLAHSKNSVKQYKNSFNLEASESDFGESLWFFIFDHIENININVGDLLLEDSEISIGDAEDFEPSIYQTLTTKRLLPENLEYVLVTWEVGAIDFEGEAFVTNNTIDDDYDFSGIEFTNESVNLNKNQFPKTEIELSSTFDGNRIRAQVASIISKDNLKLGLRANSEFIEEYW
jgi:hypothetical protein